MLPKIKEFKISNKKYFKCQKSNLTHLSSSNQSHPLLSLHYYLYFPKFPQIPFFVWATQRIIAFTLLFFSLCSPTDPVGAVFEDIGIVYVLKIVWGSFNVLVENQVKIYFVYYFMNHPRRTRKNDYYLDVTEFIMTQHRQFQVPSPHHTPLHHAQQPDNSACRFRKRIERKRLIMQITTPNNLPLVIEVGGVELSPYFRMGQGENLDIEFYDFTLEIPEEDQELSNDQNSMLQQQNQSDHDLQNSQGIQYSEHNDQYEISQYAPDVPPSRLNLKSFLQIYQELKRNQATENQLKQFIADYLTQEDLETINIEECPLVNLEQIVHNNLRYVGPISWLQRKYKVQKYKEKKKNRIWKKKISYDCRKRVADNRLRVKGKFVTKKQACNILGVNQLEEQDIKQLLECQRSHSKSTQIK